MPAAISCARTLFNRFESKNAGVDVLAEGRQSVTDKQKLVWRDLAALEPIAYGRRAHAHGRCCGGGSPKGFDNGFDCGQHAP